MGPLILLAAVVALFGCTEGPSADNTDSSGKLRQLYTFNHLCDGAVTDGCGGRAARLCGTTVGWKQRHFGEVNI